MDDKNTDGSEEVRVDVSGANVAVIQDTGLGYRIGSSGSQRDSEEKRGAGRESES